VERRHPQRRHVRDQRQIQTTVATRTLPLHRRSGDTNVARGPHAWLHPRCVVQG